MRQRSSLAATVLACAALVALQASFAAPCVAAPAIGPTPSQGPSGSVGVPGAPGAPVAKNDQAIRGDAVHIEGKLYSPQALFIVSRPAERFGRDAIVPVYLEITPAAVALPYRLRADVLPAARPSEVRPGARRAD